MISGTHFIRGRAVTSKSEAFRAVDPRSGDTLEPTFHEANGEQIDDAVTAASRSAAEWANSSPELRAQFLDTVAQEIEALGDPLIERADQETALGVPRLTGERGRTTGQLHFFAELLRAGWWRSIRIDTADPERKPIPKPDLRRTLLPLGPVAVFGASNFPLAFSVAGGDTTSAWAAGCPVVVKAHPAHPGTSELVATAILRALETCQLPTGLFSLIHGVGHQVGQSLTLHPGIAAVAFTGSFAGGQALVAASQQRTKPIPVYAEMGSINPVVILEGALRESGQNIAQGLAGSVALGSGQFCTNPGVVLVPTGAETDSFSEQLADSLSASGEMTVVHPGIATGYRQATERTLAVGEIEASLVTGEATQNDSSSTVSPQVFRCSAATFIANDDLQEEIYGPATLVVSWQSTEELNEVLHSMPGALTATLHATDRDLNDHPGLVSQLAAISGRVVINGFPTGVEVAHAMHHGGPFPATSDSRSTSVGSAAIDRFLRPVCFQDLPDSFLPPELQDANPQGVPRLVDGTWTVDAIEKHS